MDLIKANCAFNFFLHSFYRNQVIIFALFYIIMFVIVYYNTLNLTIINELNRTNGIKTPT